MKTSRRGFLGSIAAFASACFTPKPAECGSCGFSHPDKIGCTIAIKRPIRMEVWKTVEFQWEPKDFMSVMHPSGRIDILPVNRKQA